MKVNVRLSNPLLSSHDVEFSRCVRAVAEACIISNRLFLQERKKAGAPLPPLFSAGIRYQNEPEGYPDQAVDIPTIISRGWGDCLHLSCWRVAELREDGDFARIRVTSQRLSGDRRLFHVLVRLANGREEDPSKILGM